MDIVTGFKNTAHITSWQDRDLNQGIFGSDTYILGVGSKLAATIISNNEIHIADGVIMMQGCQGVVQKGTYDTISIDNGSQGMLRKDLICIEYTKVSGTGVESLAWKVVKGTPAASSPSDPSVTSGDIQNGDSPVQVPVYRVNMNGLTLESVEALVDTTQPITGIGTLYHDSYAGTYANNTPLGGAYIDVTAGLYLVFATIDFASNSTGIRSVYVMASNISDVIFYNSADYGSGYDASAISVDNTVHSVMLADVKTSTRLIAYGVQTSGGSLTGTSEITALRLK